MQIGAHLAVSKFGARAICRFRSLSSGPEGCTVFRLTSRRQGLVSEQVIGRENNCTTSNWPNRVVKESEQEFSSLSYVIQKQNR